MQTIDMAVKDIRPYENNPRRNDDAVDKVANSIREFGWQQPIVVDKDNVIIVGHTRWKAAKKLKLKTVPVVVADLSEEQAKAYRIADNSTGEIATWDYDLLVPEIQGLDYDMSEFGLDLTDTETDDEPVDVQEDDYEVPDTETMTAKTKRGDVYKLGDHVLMCGDSTDAKDMSKLMGGTKADIAFTSPPYNAHHLDVTSSAERGGKYQKCTGKKYLADNDNRTDDEYFEFLRTNLDLLMDNAEEVFYNIGVQAGSKRTIARLLDKFSDEFKDLLYWKKTNPMPVIAEGVISSAVELIIAFGLEGSRSFKHFDDRMFHGVVEGLSASSTNEYAEIHRATFPVYLPSEIISRFTERGGAVLDFFGGTGTTMIACEQLGRRAYMMELEPVYCDVIIDRWQQFTGKKAEKVVG